MSKRSKARRRARKAAREATPTPQQPKPEKLLEASQEKLVQMVPESEELTPAVEAPISEPPKRWWERLRR